jgi:hypothetical protein
MKISLAFNGLFRHKAILRSIYRSELPPDNEHVSELIEKICINTAILKKITKHVNKH